MYSFGSLVPNRHASSEDYRYGFQNQEKDDEIKGEGNSLNYEFRMHDPRVGRFFAIDPLFRDYAYFSPYQFAGNKVIRFVELEGLEMGMALPMDGTIDGKNLGHLLATDKSTEGKILRATINGVHNLINPSWWWNQAKSVAIQTWKWNGGVGVKGQLEVSQQLIDQSLSINKMIKEGDVEKIIQFAVEAVGSAIILDRVTKAPFLDKSSGFAKQAVYNFAQEVISERKIGNIPRALSVVYDNETGKFYYGESKGLKVGEKLTPELQNMLPKESKEPWSVQNCAECQALNNAFKDGAKVENLEIHTVRIDKKGIVQDFSPCKNCEITTKVVKNTSKKKVR